MAHPIENKLTQIYWYLVSAERLSTRSAYQTYQLYAYGHELLVVLWAVGILPPVARLLIEVPDSPGNGSSPHLAALFSNPGLLFWIGLISVLAWLAVKAAVSTGDLQKRSVLAKSGIREARRAENRLLNILESESDPMASLVSIHKEVYSLAERLIAEDSWHDQVLPTRFLQEAEGRVRRLTAIHAGKWPPPPQVDQPERR